MLPVNTTSSVVHCITQTISKLNSGPTSQPVTSVDTGEQAKEPKALYHCSTEGQGFVPLQYTVEVPQVSCSLNCH